LQILKAKPEISLLSITKVAGPYPCDIPRFNNRSVFFSVDADRGFQQIVNDPGSVKFTSFEMFHQLFVSLRMQFGDLNALCTFAQNCDAMLGDLKFKDKKVKNYFDDIIGGASQMDFWGLRQTKRALLERCRDHG
jgi:hypothetical protein